MKSETRLDEAERNIRDAVPGLSYHIYSKAPVKADGRINGKPFYFRSRWASWQFTVCISHDIDASAIWPTEDKQGFFVSDEYRGYYNSGSYGKDFDASYMPYDIAEKIIRDCVQQFLLAESAEQSTPN